MTKQKVTMKISAWNNYYNPKHSRECCEENFLLKSLIWEGLPHHYCQNYKLCPQVYLRLHGTCYISNAVSRGETGSTGGRVWGGERCVVMFWPSNSREQPVLLRQSAGSLAGFIVDRLMVKLNTTQPGLLWKCCTVFCVISDPVVNCDKYIHCCLFVLEGKNQQSPLIFHA